MTPNPVTDTWNFLIGNTGDYNSLGPAKYVPVALFLALLAGSVAIAAVNWSRDPAQRTGKHVAIWLIRAITAGMWFQGSIWKLPLPVSDGFTFWTGQLAKFTVLPFEASLVQHVLLPGIGVLQPLVYLFEVFLTVSLLLGVAMRFAGVMAMLFTAHLWLGLYSDPTEWAWTYGAIIAAHGMFAVTEAGRSLGLDNLLRGQWAGAFNRHPALLRAYRLAS
jgi:uncharacterized membrane protein YphA (DoxX/SURF4 family)